MSLSYRNDFKRANFRGNIRTNQTYRGKITEEDTKGIIEIKIMREVEVDSEKGSIQKILEEMTEVVVIDLDQVQELVQIETDSDAIYVGNKITLLKTVNIKKRERNKTSTTNV